MDHLLDKIELSLREKLGPLYQSLVNDIKDAVAHGAQFTGVKGVYDQFSSRFIGRVRRLSKNNAIGKEARHQVLRMLLLREELVVGVE